VREYWIFDYKKKTLDVHILENSRYRSVVYDLSGAEMTVPVSVLPGFSIDFAKVFSRLVDEPASS
jgi:Uma2 family endonuclease